MPYRRLPNTDKARIRAMEAALAKGKTTPSHQLAYSYLTSLDLQAIYPELSAANTKLNRAKESQFSKSRSYAETYRKAKLYVSHFMQVLNFAIAREELKPEVRSYYGLKVDLKNIPTLIKEEHIFKWGRKLIDGDAKRIAAGGTPIYNPTIAMVRVYYEQFEAAYTNRKALQKQTDDASGDMLDIRRKSDEVILRLWNETEAHFSHLPEEQKRTEAAKYGVVYIYRPKERERLLEQAKNETIDE
ncbi:MAG: hypothetical protein ACK5MI_08030 [Mangrovibacterium sp.]